MQILLLILFLIQNPSSKQEKSYFYHNKMADKYYHNGDFPNMIYHLQQKVKLDPHDVNTYSDLAYYYWSLSVDDKTRRQEFLSKAKFYLNEGLSKNKESAYMWDEIANFIIVSSKNYKEAIPYLIESLKRPDTPMSSYHALSIAYIKQDKIKEAIDVLEKCVIKFPEDMKAKSKLAELKKSLISG